MLRVEDERLASDNSMLNLHAAGLLSKSEQTSFVVISRAGVRSSFV